MKLMRLIRPRPAGCVGSRDATLEVNWSSTADQGEGCFVTIYTAISADNPCETSYALSCYAEVYYYSDYPTDPTLVWTGDPETHTIGPGHTDFLLANLGPIEVDVSDSQIARVLVYFTWPDSTVTSAYFDSYTASCG